MKITFGLHLDGWRSSGNTVRFDEITCGENGLLGLLELRLGLPSPGVTHARRVLGYRTALESAAAIDGQPRFYGESFAKDALATSEELLRWRDQLVLAGWDGAAEKSDGRRLCDLAAVETLASGDVTCGLGDRIRAILAEMTVRMPGDLEVTVLNAPGHFPHSMRVLLQALRARFAGAPAFPLAAAGTNLRRLQDGLIRGETTPFPWDADDCSVVLCTAFSEVTLARVAAHWLHHGGRAAMESIVIAQGPLEPLREALAALDAPTPAAQLSSVERPALQVLQLALRLRWSPLNPCHLLEFLTHALNPLPSYLRFPLADAVVEQPGVDGPRWREALAAAFEKGRECSRSDRGREPVQSKLDQLLKVWTEPERFDPAAGAPGPALAATCDLVADWARRRGAVCENATLRSHLLAAYDQAAELAEILRPEERVSATQLERFLRLVQGTGISDEPKEDELGAVRCHQDPAAVIEPADDVYWWGIERQIPPACAPWSWQERESLAARGVLLQVTSDLHEAQQAAAVLPVLAARKRLLLFLPKSRNGEPVQHHPLLDRLHAMIQGSRSIPALQVDAALSNAGAGLGTVALPRRPLPSIRRWWHLGRPDLLAPRARESFTSLGRFVYQPFAWVLDYKARLKPGAFGQMQIVADQRQKGTLIHRLVERLFDKSAEIDWRTASLAEFSTWLEQHWLHLLPTEAANLLLPGQQAAGQSLRDECQRALWRLVSHLRTAGIVNARADVQPADASFAGGVVGGNIDLLVERADGSKGVVDLKYGGRERRRAELRDNLQLQLAVYGNLVASEAKGQWPEGAYFILKEARMLAQNDRLFPDADVVKVSAQVGAPGLKDCWQDFMDVWKWRRDQLDSGWIELSLEGTDPESAEVGAPGSEPPHTRWTPQDVKAEDRFDDFVALTGWGESA